MKTVMTIAAALFASVGTAAAAPSFVADGVLSACVDPTFPPMEYVQEVGKAPAGFDIDLTKALAKHWGATAEFATMDFSGLLPALEAQRCDVVISGLQLKPERLIRLSGVPYLKTGAVMIGRVDEQSSFSSYEDFSGKVVALQSGTANTAMLERVSDGLERNGKLRIVLQEYPKQTDCIRQVLVGRATAAISQDTEFAFRDLQEPGALKVLYAAERAEEYAAYFRKSAEDEQAFTAALDALRKSGQLLGIASKWKLPAVSIEGLQN